MNRGKFAPTPWWTRGFDCALLRAAARLGLNPLAAEKKKSSPRAHELLCAEAARWPPVQPGGAPWCPTAAAVATFLHPVGKRLQELLALGETGFHSKGRRVGQATAETLFAFNPLQPLDTYEKNGIVKHLELRLLDQVSSYGVPIDVAFKASKMNTESDTNGKEPYEVGKTQKLLRGDWAKLASLTKFCKNSSSQDPTSFQAQAEGMLSKLRVTLDGHDFATPGAPMYSEAEDATRRLCRGAAVTALRRVLVSAATQLTGLGSGGNGGGGGLTGEEAAELVLTRCAVQCAPKDARKWPLGKYHWWAPRNDADVLKAICMYGWSQDGMHQALNDRLLRLKEESCPSLMMPSLLFERANQIMEATVRVVDKEVLNWVLPSSGQRASEKDVGGLSYLHKLKSVLTASLRLAFPDSDASTAAKTEIVASLRPYSYANVPFKCSEGCAFKYQTAVPRVLNSEKTVRQTEMIIGSASGHQSTPGPPTNATTAAQTMFKSEADSPLAGRKREFSNTVSRNGSDTAMKENNDGKKKKKTTSISSFFAPLAKSKKSDDKLQQTCKEEDFSL